MKKLEPYMMREDTRGRLVGLINEGSWEEFNYLETKAGNIRGNHYHKGTREGFFIIDGELDVLISSSTGSETKMRVSSGDVFIIEPGEVHTFYCLTQ